MYVIVVIFEHLFQSYFQDYQYVQFFSNRNRVQK